MRRFVAVIAAFAAAHSASAVTLYAITTTNLVRFDSDNPGAVTVIGPHGLPEAGAYGVNYLVYHPLERAFFGLYYTSPQPVHFQMSLIRFNPSTGVGLTVADLGSSAPNLNVYESLEYVSAQQSMLVSRGPGGSSDSFLRIGPTGATLALCSNGRDNDYTVFDSARSLFYTIDPNGVAQLTASGIVNCITDNLGPLGVTLGDLAYHPADDAIYAVDYLTNRLHRLKTTDGGAPFTRTDIGPVGATTIRGLAVIPPACVADLNADGVVSTPDLVQFLGDFGQQPIPGGPAPAADFNFDTVVDTADLAFFLGRFGGQCR